MDITEQIRRTIKKYDMIKTGDRVVVGVSGGADSVSLLYILSELKNEFGISIYVAHLDHMLRGSESEKDMEFVQGIAEQLSLPISTDRVDIKTTAKEEGLSIEECARDARYDFFVRVAKEFKANKIAVGHTKDDQAETILMRVLRGSGTRGLGGIPPLRQMNGCVLIRPFIEIWREEIERYLKDNKIPYRQDASNQSLDYFRNKIRHDLLPYINKDYNPNIKDILTHIAENVYQDYEYIRTSAENKFPSCAVDITQDRIILDLKRFSKYPKAIQKELLRLAIARVKGDLRRVEFRHLNELEELILTRPQGSVVDLSKDIAVKKLAEHLIVYKK